MKNKDIISEKDPMALRPYPAPCIECGVPKKMEEFVALDGEGYVKRCLECRVSNDSLSVAARREMMKLISKQSNELLARAEKSESVDFRKFSEWAREITDNAGGFEQMSAFTWNEIKAAADARPGSKVVIDSLFKIIKLHGEAEDRYGDQRSMSEYTDEELDELLASGVQEALVGRDSFPADKTA